MSRTENREQETESSRTRGFTLLETVVVIGLTALVSGALLFAIRQFYVHNAYIFEATAAVDSVRRGVATSLSNLREASYADDGNYPIASASATSIVFYSDVDADGGIERVKLWRSGDTFYKVVTNAAGNPPSYAGQANATTTIATYVRNTADVPIFAYYDSEGTLLSSASDISAIASVSVTLMVDLNPHRAPNVLTLSGSATLRNLRNQ